MKRWALSTSVRYVLFKRSMYAFRSGLPGWIVMAGDAVRGAPVDEGLRSEFGAVVPSECEVKARQVLL
jgi:hypothetical protein